MNSLGAKVLIVLSLVLSPLTLLSPAEAIGTGAPVVVSPANHTAVPAGSTGPVTVNFANAPSGEYGIRLECDTGYLFEVPDTTTYDGTQDTLSWTIDELPSRAVCGLDVYRHDVTSDSTVASSRFWVGKIDPDLTFFDSSTTTFYPFVTDGNRDTAHVEGLLSGAVNLSFQVLNPAGVVVRSTPTQWHENDVVRWVWNGRRNDGSLVKPGTYRIRAVGTLDGVTRAWTTEVTAFTGKITVRKTLTKNGVLGRFTATRNGLCGYASYGTTSMSVRCDLGSTTGRYRFAIPAKATRLRWSIDGHRTEGDRCCAGKLAKSGKRVSPRKYVVSITIGTKREYTINRARVRYSIRTRV